MIPSKTKFFRWNDKTQGWEEPQIIEDVTGRATDKKFTCKAVKTEWKISTVPIRAFKILMYGEGICLTEIKILCTTVNGQEKWLIPNSQPNKIENGKEIKRVLLVEAPANIFSIGVRLSLMRATQIC